MSTNIRANKLIFIAFQQFLKIKLNRYLNIYETGQRNFTIFLNDFYSYLFIQNIIIIIKAFYISININILLF